MLHVMSARCVARDLHTIAPGPLESRCWREFATQWGDCQKSRIAHCQKSRFAPLNAIIIIIIIIINLRQHTLHSRTRARMCMFRAGSNSMLYNRLVGLVVKASASGVEDPGFESRLRRGCSGSRHTSDFKIGSPVATLPGAWRHTVSAGTGWPGVSILWIGEMESLICNFYLCVTACTIVWADPSLRYTSMLLGR